LPDIIQAINTNSGRVRQVHADNARLSVPGLVTSLQANLSFERPRRFRLTGITGLMGAVLDLGSNDEIYWMWTKNAEPPAVFYGRHDQFFSSSAQEVLPVPPHWLIEALGIVYLDPNGIHEGPSYATSIPGALEVRSRLPTPKGELTRVLLVEQQHGWILQQHLLDASGRLLVSAVASDFRYDAVHGVSLPAKIDVNLPAAQIAFSFETDRYVINEPYVLDDPRPRRDPRELWTMPQIPGHQPRDLADPQVLREFMQPLSRAKQGPLSHISQQQQQHPQPYAQRAASYPAQQSPRSKPWSLQPPRAALRRTPPFSAIR
jgi:hypothetical protein